jgi:hypothetical protein
MKVISILFILGFAGSVFACGENKATDSTVKTEEVKKKKVTTKS